MFEILPSEALSGVVAFRSQLAALVAAVAAGLLTYLYLRRKAAEEDVRPPLRLVVYAALAAGTLGLFITRAIVRSSIVQIVYVGTYDVVTDQVFAGTEVQGIGEVRSGNCYVANNSSRELVYWKVSRPSGGHRLTDTDVKHIQPGKVAVVMTMPSSYHWLSEPTFLHEGCAYVASAEIYKSYTEGSYVTISTGGSR